MLMRRTLSNCFRFAAAAAAVVLLAGSAQAQSSKRGAEHEVTITITKVKAIDKIDAFSKADFFARVTIDGAVLAVPPVKQQTEIQPNWTISKKVRPGRVAVKLEVLDKDLTKDELIDINRLPNKRHQDFIVDTRSCRVEGFAGSPRCGATIVRGGAGDERKAAEVSFIVTVKK